MNKIGLIVNPIAGMGGCLGLKGTDGMVDEVIKLGAIPKAPDRAINSLNVFAKTCSELQILTAEGLMGEAEAQQAGFAPEIVYSPEKEKTTGEDTIRAAKKLVQKGIDLLLFAGGDGTARDICSVVGETVPVIGIPAGVKIHSPVFAQTPERAGSLAGLVLQEKLKNFHLAEVLDIDEDAYRQGEVTTTLHGYMNVPVEKRMQNRKAGSPMSERATQNLICLDIIDNMEPGFFYLIGPGSTNRPLLENLGLPCTLLGVDIIKDRKLIAKDVSEAQILQLVQGKKFKIVVTPTGGQGYLFGRGNQQLSPAVLSLTEKNDIIIASTDEKLTHLKGEPLHLDTGDNELDCKLAGYYRVITGVRKQLMYKVE